MTNQIHHGLDLVTAILKEFPEAEMGWVDRHLLLMAASESGHGELLEMLLESGADPEWDHPSGFTLLLAACGSGHVECVEVLFRSRIKD